LKAGERWPAERAAYDEKGKDNANMEMTSEEEKDYNNNEEEDCVAATAAATTAAATAAATAGHHSSSAATASDQAVTAVTAARRSSLRWGTVAAAADSRMPSLTPVFFVFFVNVCSTWHRMPCFMGPFLRNSGRIPDSGGFRNKFILPRNGLIPMGVLPESGNSAKFYGWRQSREDESRGINATTSPRRRDDRGGGKSDEEWEFLTA